jgi:site-specific recombinase XerD
MNQQSFKAYLEKRDLSRLTVVCYLREVYEFIDWLETQQIETQNSSARDLMAYLNHLQQKGQGAKTRSINLGILRHYFSWQLEEQLRIDNPAQHIKIRGAQGRKLYPIFSKEELERLYYQYTAADETHKKAKCNWFAHYKIARQRNKAVLSLMVYQGLSTDEANRLRVQDVNLKEGKLFVQSSRSSNERILELKSLQIIEQMEYQLQVRTELERMSSTKRENYFLPVPSAGKKTVTQNTTVNMWKALSKELKKQNPKFINFLQVRSSVITYWLSNYNLRQVQYMAGHRWISSTERYKLNQTDDLQNDIEQFHPIG